MNTGMGEGNTMGQGQSMADALKSKADDLRSQAGNVAEQVSTKATEWAGEAGQAMQGTPKWVVPTIVIGSAVLITWAATRRARRTRWDVTRDVTEKLMDHREDFTEAGRDIVERVQTIYNESRAVVEQLASLWGQGRKLLRP